MSTEQSSYRYNKKALWAILLCAGFLFYKYILQVYPTVITTQLMSDFNLSGAGLGNLAATFYYSYMIMQLFSGGIIDKYGTRNVAVPAIFIAAIGMLLFSYSHTVWLAGIARAFMGAGVAFATVAYMKTAADWFPAKHYAFIGGLLATAVMLGAVFGEAPLAFFVSCFGWRYIIFGMGVLGILLALLFWCVVNNKPHKDNSENPQKEFFSWPLLWAVLKNRNNWLLTLYSGFVFSPLAVMGGLWGTPFLSQAYLLSPTKASAFVSLCFVGFGVGGPLLGLLSDRIGRWPVMFFSTLLSLLSISLILYVPDMSSWALSSLLFFFGFFVGAFMLAFAVGKEANPIAMTATVIAMINASDAILDAATEPAIGKFLDWHSHGAIVNGVHFFSTRDYQLALSILPVYTLFSLYFVWKLRLKR
ncbi:MAG: MFS transporter [Legionellales bacterium]|nr:MFS transporter [Legionellales bacterium]